ncbi:MAG: hypothetical protein GY906_23165 [bacterium]|nr:hypothetical protein [bacterium]
METLGLLVVVLVVWLGGIAVRTIAARRVAEGLTQGSPGFHHGWHEDGQHRAECECLRGGGIRGGHVGR